MKTTGKTKRKSPSDRLREEKLAAFQAQISRGQEILSELSARQMELSQYELVGVTVSHRRFGEGQVVEKNQKTIRVAFGGETKQFMMPSAFYDGFLSTADVRLKEKLAQYREYEALRLHALNEIAGANREIDALCKK